MTSSTSPPPRRASTLTSTAIGLASIAVAGLVVVGLGGIVATGRPARDTVQSKPRPTCSIDRAHEVLARRHAELLHRFDAVGVGVRRRSLEDPEAVLVVYLVPSAVAPTDALRVDGVPVLFEITGRTRRSLDSASPSPSRRRVPE